MNRSQPVSNKICSAEWDRMRYTGHRKRLNKVKSSIDTSAPTQYSHLITRSKKEQQLEERYTQIENENRILLKKMSYIMRNSSLDNLNYYRPRSLNAVARKRELKRIMGENQAILKRIQTRKPFYNRREWDSHTDMHESYVENIREKPIPRISSAPGAGFGPKKRRGPRNADGTNRLKPLESNKGRKKKGRPGSRGAAGGNNTDNPGQEISKGGRNIDGQYVIVTVDEIGAPTPALFFKTYDVQSCEDDGVKVTFEQLSGIASDEDLISNLSRREELANSLLDRLKFRDGRLAFDLEGSDGAEQEAETQAMKQEAEEYLKESEQSHAEATDQAAPKEDTPADTPAKETAADDTEVDKNEATENNNDTAPPEEAASNPPADGGTAAEGEGDVQRDVNEL